MLMDSFVHLKLYIEFRRAPNKPSETLRDRNHRLVTKLVNNCVLIGSQTAPAVFEVYS